MVEPNKCEKIMSELKVAVIGIGNIGTAHAACIANGQIKGDRVQIPYLVGMLFDEDGLMIDYQLDTARSTPIEARKGYRNVWYTFCKNIVSDATENAIIYYMEDPAVTPGD